MRHNINGYILLTNQAPLRSIPHTRSRTPKIAEGSQLTSALRHWKDPRCSDSNRASLQRRRKHTYFDCRLQGLIPFPSLCNFPLPTPNATAVPIEQVVKHFYTLPFLRSSQTYGKPNPKLSTQLYPAFAT